MAIPMVKLGSSFSGVLPDSKYFIPPRRALLVVISTKLGRARPFVRNVLTAAAGSALAHAVALAFTPLLTRLYGPDAMGAQAVFLSVVGLAGNAAALGYPVAIVLPEQESDARALARLSVLAGCVICALLCIALLVWPDGFASLVNAQSIPGLAGLIPFAALCGVLAATMEHWLIRRQAFALMARCAVVTAMSLGLAKVVFGHVDPSALSLILAHTGGVLLGLVLTFAAWRQSGTDQATAPAAGPGVSLWEMAKRYRDFPLLRTPQTLINTLSQSLPVLLLASLFGPGVAGYYGLAQSLLALPAVLIGGAVVSVLYRRMTEAVQRREDARALLMRATVVMALTGFLPFLAIALFGPSLFSFVFGSDWTAAGVYAQWLAPWLFLQYVNRPVVSAVPALGLQGSLLIYELFSTGSKVLALWIGFSVFRSAVVAVAAFSFAGVVAYVYLICWVIAKAPRRHRVE